MAGPYELYLVRHGIAEERGDGWPDDGKRPLTSKGIARLKQIARGLDRLGVTFEALSPDGTAQTLLAELDKQSRRTRIALVGHEPGIGELAARLAGLRRPIEFKKGAVCRIDLQSLPLTGPGTLRWFATPRMLRSVARR
jgi:phosphohistidine phosphatase